jgi:hypothetical protein
MLLQSAIRWVAPFGAIGGILPLILWWKFSSRRKRNQRLVDLGSYAITLIALGTGLLSLHRSDSQWSDMLDGIMVAEKHIDAQFDDSTEYSTICNEIRHTPFQMNKVKRADCSRLGDYLSHLQPALPGSIPLENFPPISALTDPELRTFAQRITRRASDANNATLKYVQNRHQGPEPFEAQYLLVVLPMLSFALGLGVSRRALDAYQDWRL